MSTNFPTSSEALCLLTRDRNHERRYRLTFKLIQRTLLKFLVNFSISRVQRRNQDFA